MIVVRGLLDGEKSYSQREKYFLGYEGSNEDLSAENWPKIAEDIKIGTNDEVMLLAVAIDYEDISFYIKKIDGKPPCTDEEISQRDKSIVLHTEPSENAFVATTENELQQLRNNISKIEGKIIIPSLFTIGRYRK